MIFNNQSIIDVHDDIEIQDYISTYSDTDSGCHSILSYSDKMTDSDKFDISPEFPITPASDNMTTEEFHSYQYYNDIATMNRHQQMTPHPMHEYQLQNPSNQYNQSISYGQEIPPAKNSSNSTSSDNLNFDKNACLTYSEDHDSPQQASPDSQHSQFVFNINGKYIVLI